MSPLPSSSTAVPKAEASQGLTQLAAGVGPNEQVHLMGLKEGQLYHYGYQDKNAKWEVKNEILHFDDGKKYKYKSLILSKGYDNRLYAVCLTVEGKLHVPCYQSGSNNGWTKNNEQPRQDNETRYGALSTGMGDGNTLHVLGLTENNELHEAYWQGDGGQWKSGSFSHGKSKYKALATGMASKQHVFGLTEDGKAHLVAYKKRDPKEGAPWESGQGDTPKDNQEFIALVVGTGNDKTMQVVGLTRKGLPYVPFYRTHQKSDGKFWHAKGELPNGGNQQYQTLVTGMGTNKKLQVLGLGVDNKLYHVCSHDGGAEWAPGKQLSELENRKYSAITIARSAKDTLLVFGLSEPDRVPYLVCWQDRDGDWNPGPPLTTDTKWVGIQKQGFSPNHVYAKPGDAIVFYLMDREVTTDLSTSPDGVFQDSRHITVHIGGISFHRFNKEGFFRTSRVRDQDEPPNEPMQGTITVGDGGGTED